ncbi:hypothetical protein [Streptomyces catenulae]|uniref:Uncharacterized protein n=1 Tax=Streptomyces catenulae TaxID=66875 RepID=A0ABV2Z006_9ACTN|nr:hypothetical protein [Streptomyces catenulae]
MAENLAADLSGINHGASQTDELSAIVMEISQQTQTVSLLANEACGSGDETSDQLRKTLLPGAEAFHGLLGNLAKAFQQTAEDTLGTQKSFADTEQANIDVSHHLKQRMTR